MIYLILSHNHRIENKSDEHIKLYTMFYVFILSKWNILQIYLRDQFVHVIWILTYFNAQWKYSDSIFLKKKSTATILKYSLLYVD